MAVDPATGIVYLTEDDFRGFVVPDPENEIPGTGMRASFLYRYLPETRPKGRGTHIGAASCRSCHWKRNQNTTLT